MSMYMLFIYPSEEVSNRIFSYLSINQKQKNFFVYIDFVLRTLDNFVCLYDRLDNKEMLSI
jgi:hypothetical protein